MKDNKEKLKQFEQTANNLLDSLKAFAPSIEGMKELVDVELTDEAKTVIDEFSSKGANLDNIEDLKKLKKEYLQKLGDVIQ